MKTDRSGMTLVEVLLAAMLLGLGMMTVFTGLSRCLRLIQDSRDIQKMQLAFDRGNLAHPMADIQSEDDIRESVEKLLAKGADMNIANGAGVSPLSLANSMANENVGNFMNNWKK